MTPVGKLPLATTTIKSDRSDSPRKVCLFLLSFRPKLCPSIVMETCLNTVKSLAYRTQKKEEGEGSFSQQTAAGGDSLLYILFGQHQGRSTMSVSSRISGIISLSSLPSPPPPLASFF